MAEDRKVDELTERIISLLNGRVSFSGRSESSVLFDGRSCSYLFSITRVDLNTLIFHEDIITADGASHTSRNWVFSRSIEWTVSSADKNGTLLDSGSIELELNDACERIDNLGKKRKTPIDIPLGPVGRNGTGDFASRKINNLVLLIAAAVLVCGFFTALIFNSFGYSHISGIVNNLEESIGSSTELNQEAISRLGNDLQDVQGELARLKDSVAQEKEAFFFSRQNTAANIRRMAEELPRKYYSRRKAYDFIALQVESAATYGDFIYQVSRLPQSEAQAETLLATDADNVTTLDDYDMVFSGLVYPVRLDNGANDGRSFMISSGYMERRVNPIGTGGIRPHYAIDIINIKNIIDITPDNKIVRTPGLPGAIVSTADGVIRDISYDEVYGWNVEVEHVLTDEILKAYPDATKWTSFYAHMNKPTGWKVGDSIKKNDKIGDIGEAGRATGPHLHFEIRIYQPSGNEKGLLGTYTQINPVKEKKGKLKK